MQEKYSVYTDGGYSSNRDQGGWSFVVVQNDEKIFSDFGAVLKTTNNRMEISSTIEAIKYMNSINVKEFTLYSDSMYLIGTVTKGWQRRKNTDLWIELDNLILKDIKIIWTHVKGHSGNKWNNYCDMLCVHATKLINC